MVLWRFQASLRFNLTYVANDNYKSLMSGKATGNIYGLMFGVVAIICDGLSSHNTSIVRGTSNPSVASMMISTAIIGCLINLMIGKFSSKNRDFIWAVVSNY